MNAHSRSLILTVLLTVFLLLPRPSHSAALPSDDDVSGIVKACAGGRFQQIEGDVKAKISVWKKNAELSGKISREDLGALLKQVPQNQQISPDNYKLYTDCILNAMTKYLKAETDCPNGTGIRIENSTNIVTRGNTVEGYDCGIVDKGGAGNRHEKNKVVTPPVK